MALLWGGGAFFEGEVALLVLLAAAAGAGIVAADAGAGAGDGALLGGGCSVSAGAGGFAVGLDGPGRAALRHGRQAGGSGALRRGAGGRLRDGGLLYRLDPHGGGDDAGGDAALHDLEELEPFLLLLDLLVLLAVAAQVDALAQVVHLQQVVLPELIDRVQVRVLHELAV